MRRAFQLLPPEQAVGSALRRRFAIRQRHEVGDVFRFERRLERVSRSDTEAVLEREIRFDPDLWVLALETEDITDLVALADGEPPPQSAADSLFRR